MRVVRRLAALAAILVWAMALMGMGGFGETSVISKIPEPDRDFTVTIVDVTDTTFSATDFSVEGLTLVPVELGKAKISIDFAKVEEVLFLHQGDSLSATVSFKGGEVKKVTMSPNTLFYGRTPWGLMQLAAKDIKSLHF